MAAVLTFHILSAALGLAVASWAELRPLGGAPVVAPGLRQPARLALAMSAMAFVLWLAVFEPLASLGQVPQVDLAEVPTSSLFAVQILLLAAIVVWWSAAWLGVDERWSEVPVDGRLGTADDAVDSEGIDPAGLPPDLQAGVPRSRLRRRLEGLRLWSDRPLRELGLGLVAGVLAWGGVLLTVIVVAAVAMALGEDGFVSEPPSEIIVWMVELGIGTRLLISLSAGVAEELFFRGYLQPRLGILPSTLFFVAAHAGYGRPFMLLGVCLLSLLYGLLSRWRGNIWAAISAHFLFDALQLLVVIPAALRAAESVS